MLGVTLSLLGVAIIVSHGSLARLAQLSLNAVLFLGEHVHLYHALGAAAAAAGIFLASLQAETAQRPLPQKAATRAAECR
jgi:hypothetical protein